METGLCVMATPRVGQRSRLFGNIATRSALGMGSRLGRHYRELSMALSRNLLAVLVLILVAALAVTGYSLYQEKKQPDGVEISVGKNGLSIKEK